MISIRKLESLPRDTRLRRIVKLLEQAVSETSAPPPRYLQSLCRLIRKDVGSAQGASSDHGTSSAQTMAAVQRLVDLDHTERDTGNLELVRLLDDLRHAIMGVLGIDVADWDLLHPVEISESKAQTSRGNALADVGIYLDSIRSPFNLGSIVRTAAAYGVRSVGLSPESVTPEHPRAVRSAMGSLEFVHIHIGSVSEYVDACVSHASDVIALETDGEDINYYAFPTTGILVLGSEELGIRPTVRRQSSGCVRIPMYGAKRSLNVGVACGIALHAWQQSVSSR